MEKVNRVRFSLNRTLRKSKYRFIILCLFIFLSNIDYSNCYSNVRRSGSSATVDELNRASIESKDFPNISPMLRPANTKTADQSYNIDIKQTQISRESTDPIITYSNDNLKSNEAPILKDIQEKNKEEFVLESGFKPITIEHKQEKVIQYQENKQSEEHKMSIIEQIGAAKIEDDAPANPKQRGKLTDLERELLGYVDETMSKASYDIFEGIKIEPVSSLRGRDLNTSGNGAPRSLGIGPSEGDPDDFDHQVMDKFVAFAKSHVVSVNLPQTARFFGFKFGQGKSSFLTGFGLGFLAFGLKKLLLPIFVGAQILKSVLIAMFLPSILGSLGKIVGKGLSQFSGASFNSGQPVVQMDDDYKEMGYTTEQDSFYDYPKAVGTLPANALDEGMEDLANVAMSRFGPGGAKVTYVPSISDNYYRAAHKKQEDYKVFHNIPASSLLLSNYDPFYSPLLSRLDSVFQRLGLGGAQSTQGAAPERCREKLVCLMYASPAKYAPYSNLVSAQLSRELNELRKPTSDNPEILRFFRYMKAAKDGQEGGNCARTYPGCPALTAETGSAAMVTTYNDINKLVAARKL